MSYIDKNGIQLSPVTLSKQNLSYISYVDSEVKKRDIWTP